MKCDISKHLENSAEIRGVPGVPGFNRIAQQLAHVTRLPVGKQIIDVAAAWQANHLNSNFSIICFEIRTSNQLSGN